MNIERSVLKDWVIDFLIAMGLFFGFILLIQLVFGSLNACYFMVCGPT